MHKANGVGGLEAAAFAMEIGQARLVALGFSGDGACGADMAFLAGLPVRGARRPMPLLAPAVNLNSKRKMKFAYSLAV